jgi:hypothetical protein
MPAQIGDWLADLAGSDAESAAEVGAALLALMTAGAIPGRPLVIDPDEPRPSLYPDLDQAAGPREALDLSYQHMLESLQKIRREVADAATNRHSIEIQLGADNLDQPMRAALERQLAAARGLETALMRPSQQLQRLVDRFRTAKETAKAVATAAEALLAEIRDDGWPAESLEVTNPESFTTHFFAGRGPELTARAIALTAVTLLTDLRERHEMSMAQVAGRAGISEGQVKLLELRGAQDAEVEVLAAYVRALGGSLRLTASIDGQDYRLG